MVTLGNKRKLAAVSRETPESTRNSRTENTLDPESTQDHISQVSAKIEGRVTDKLTKEFSNTESRFLGSLSKLDEFLLNPQVRTCSVASPGTSRNNISENRETTGDRSSDDPCPKVRYSSHHYGHVNSPEVGEYPHSCVLSSFSASFAVVILSDSSCRNLGKILARSCKTMRYHCKKIARFLQEILVLCISLARFFWFREIFARKCRF